MYSKNFIIGLNIKCLRSETFNSILTTKYLKIHFITLVVNQYYFKTVLNMLNVTYFFSYTLQCLLLII